MVNYTFRVEKIVKEFWFVGTSVKTNVVKPANPVQDWSVYSKIAITKSAKALAKMIVLNAKKNVD